MLFHTFNSQEDRRKYGGSAFIEMQFCVLPAGTGIKNIVAVDKIQNWLNTAKEQHPFLNACQSWVFPFYIRFAIIRTE